MSSDREKGDVNSIMGVDLSTEITTVLRSVMPVIVEETLRKVQEERRGIEENEERLRKLKEHELQEWKNRTRFLVARPTEFRGALNPIVVSDWIMEMENTFEICELLDDRKVLYASFMLRGEALYWWNMVKVLWKTENKIYVVG